MQVSRWLLEALHYAAALPLLAALLWRPRLPAAPLLVAAGFGVSVLGDLVAELVGGSFAASYFWLPVQMGLVLAAFPPDNRLRVLWASVVFVAAGGLAAASWRLTAPGPDVLVSLAGSVAIVAAVRGPLRLSAYLYFGVVTVCYLLFVQRIGDGWERAWALYQAARVGAFLAFVGALPAVNRERQWPA